MLFAAAVTIVVSCAVNPVTGKKQIMLMSEAQEVALGVSYDPQVMATFGEYADADMQTLCSGKRHGNGQDFSPSGP